MATHSSVLAWRISGTGEPGGLLSVGSHRVRHDWSNLAAAAAAAKQPYYHIPLTFKFTFSSFPDWLYNHYLSSPKYQKCLWYHLFFSQHYEIIHQILWSLHPIYLSNSHLFLLFIPLYSIPSDYNFFSGLSHCSYLLSLYTVLYSSNLFSTLLCT